MDIEFGPAEPGAVIGLTSVMGDNITDVHWSLFFDEDGTLQEFNSELQLSKWTRGLSFPLNFNPFDHLSLVSCWVIMVRE